MVIDRHLVAAIVGQVAVTDRAVIGVNASAESLHLGQHVVVPPGVGLYVLKENGCLNFATYCSFDRLSGGSGTAAKGSSRASIPRQDRGGPSSPSVEPHRTGSSGTR